MTVRLSATGIRVVLLDIEGTTTPVAFVYEVLFPFARAHMAEYLAREQHGDGCRHAIALLHDERTADVVGGGWPPSPDAEDSSPAAVVAYVHWLMDRDRKSPGLKMLQGLVWQAGYRSGELRGEVYADVPPAFERWRTRGQDIYIYSSGSVLAQQLLFSTTPAGDLTTALSGYFDTSVGPKTSPESYSTIMARIAVPPAQALFVSDVVAELDAARQAGINTALCIRGTGSPASRGEHPVIHTFSDILT